MGLRLNGDFRIISFEENILEFKNIKTGISYLCDGEEIRRKDGKNAIGELSQADQYMFVAEFLYIKTSKQYQKD